MLPFKLFSSSSPPGLEVSTSSVPKWQHLRCPALRQTSCALHRPDQSHLTAALHAPAGLQPQPLLLRKAAVFVTRILVVFGISEASPGGIGFGGEGSSSSSTDDGSAPLLDVFAAFRDTVRGLAREQPASGAILQACDRCAPAGPGWGSVQPGLSSLQSCPLSCPSSAAAPWLAGLSVISARQMSSCGKSLIQMLQTNLRLRLPQSEPPK